MTAQVEILWLSTELQSAERCVILATAGPGVLSGTALLPCGGAPAQIEYSIDVDEQWTTKNVGITIASHTQQVLRLNHSDAGWLVDGVERPDLTACVDVDLGWTPATNTLPLRRVPLDVGASCTTAAAWVRFPELDVVPSEQTYTRIDADRVLYQSETFEAHLVVSAEGIVTTYGEGLWTTGALRRST